MTFSLVQQIKLHIVELVGLSRDSLHVHLGLLVYFAWVAIRRASLGSCAALLAAVAVAAGIEVLDLVDDRSTYGAPRWGASLYDLADRRAGPLRPAGARVCPGQAAHLRHGGTPGARGPVRPARAVHRPAPRRRVRQRREPPGP